MMPIVHVPPAARLDPQVVEAMVNSLKFVPDKAGAVQPVAADPPELVTVKRWLALVLPTVVFANAKVDELSAMLAGLKPVAVIPLAVEFALIPALQLTDKAVANAAAEAGVAVTLKLQLPPAAIVAQDAVELRLKLVLSPMETLQPLAAVCPLLLKVTVVAELLVPWVRLPNGIVGVEKLRLTGERPVT